MSLNIYLNFDGNCREAFEFYRLVFGGEFAAFMTWADAPPDLAIAGEHADRVMHVSLPVGTSVLMGSDAHPEHCSELTVGGNFSISAAGESREHCDRLIAALSKGGEITMAMEDTFWGSYFGTCRDRFGINWMIDFALEP